MYQCYQGIYDVQACGGFRPPSLSTDVLNYWERSFFQRMRALYKIHGLPEAGPGQIGWDYDAFLYQLLRMGYAVVFNSKTYGLVVQPGAPTGFGLQFQPRGMMVQTPFFQFDRPLEIGTECAVIKLTPDYRGVWDIIEKYAVEMQQLEVSIRQAVVNSRFAYAAIAKDDKDRRTLETIFEQLENGKPAIVVNGQLQKPVMNKNDAQYQLPIMQFDRDLSKNFILPDLYDLRRKTLQDFYRELGIRVQPDKKERLVTTESASADAETYNRREVWKISLDESVKVCNDMYGTNLSIEINEPPELREGGAEDANVLGEHDEPKQHEPKQ